MRSLLLLLLLPTWVSAQPSLEEAPRELSTLVGASRRVRQELQQAEAATRSGDPRVILESYLGLLEGSSSLQQEDLFATLVAVPATPETDAGSCYRRAGDVLLARLRALPGVTSARYLERTAPSVRTLWSFLEATGDPGTRRQLGRLHTLHPEGARALLQEADLALEAGRSREALSALRHWLAHVGTLEEAPAVHARRALAAALEGELGLARREAALAGESAPAELSALLPPRDPGLLNGGVAPDLPPAVRPDWLRELLQRDGTHRLRLQAPDWVLPLQAQVNSRFSVEARRRSASATDFQLNHPLHLALPLLEPVRARNLLICTTPETLRVVSLDGDRTQFQQWVLPVQLRPIRSVGPLAQALTNQIESQLSRFPVPRMSQQWTRLSIQVQEEPSAGGAAVALVVYAVLGEDSVLRGHPAGPVLVKLEVATRIEGRYEAHTEPLHLWTATLDPYRPSGRPLLRTQEGRLAVAVLRDPESDETSLEVGVAEVDLASGELVSLTPVTRPPPNHAWAQDEEVLAHVHPLSLGRTATGLLVLADNRGTVAALELPPLAPPGERVPSGQVVWASTYRSHHIDGDAMDSGLRGWCVSGIACMEDGGITVVPADADHLLCLGPDRYPSQGGAGPDLELPVTWAPREDGAFLLGCRDGLVLLQGSVARAFDPVRGTGWEAAPRAPDGIILRRGCLVQGGHLVDPGRRELRILETTTGRLQAIVELPAPVDLPRAASFLMHCERLGVALLGDQLVLITEQGLVGWRVTP